MTTMHSIDINPDDPASIEAALRTEWLLTNGLGGYAMGTALGANTRRYHGLLVAATKPPVGRIVALHSMIEQLIVPRDDGTEDVIDLSTQQFVGSAPSGELMLHPNGYRHLVAFEQIDNESVRWQWRFREWRIVRVISFGGVPNVVDVNYSAQGPPNAVRLRLRPMMALRDFHGLNAAGEQGWSVAYGRSKQWLKVRCGEVESDLETWNESWKIDAQRWNCFAYESDRLRGQEWIEDVWSPGFMELGGESLKIKGGFAASAYVPAAPANKQILPARTSSQAGSAASQFIVQRVLNNEAHTSVIAGYPWFGDWGRDTMIALPGLMLCTGRLDDARSTLLNFARHLRNGLIPNLFDDYGGAAHYNTVDASLWFIHAVHACWLARQKSRDRDNATTWDELLRACREIIRAYRTGTDFSIRMDDRDGLIAAGDATTQLTWMDAARDGVVFTPRFGKAVEINALWHHALICLSEMTDQDSQQSELLTLARRVAAAFRAAFWWEERQCLHDCLLPVPAARSDDACAAGAVRYDADGTLRPNQIFAVSLLHSPLIESQQRAVVKTVGERLLTSYGLRTLDRDDPGYRGRYEGNLFERDAAYHNGTVWPWLIGPYCEALLRVENFSDEAKTLVRAIIQPLIDDMHNASGGRCLGQIAEVYDGDPPHRPSGCPAQAWSVAETLRVMHMIDVNIDIGSG